jgi:hypothetical protein
MDVSRCVARAAASGATTGFAVELDLLPARSREELTALLRDAASRPGSPAAASLFADVLPRRLLAAVLRAAGLEAGVRANALPRAGRHALVEALKALRVPVSGTAGYEKAEVTAGGLALSELDPGTLRVRRHEDLWVFGELIDLDGPIGGLNFQAAFATAELAGRDAGR